jgi:hypothetical protein
MDTVNLDDLLELKNLGFRVNKGIKEKCIDAALQQGHQFDEYKNNVKNENVYTCKRCKKYVYDAMFIRCERNVPNASATPNAEQSVSDAATTEHDVNGPPPSLPLKRTTFSSYPNVHASAFNARNKGGRRTKRNKRKNKRRTTCR